MINIIIADDQPILRESLKCLIEQEDNLKVIATAGNGNEALQLCNKSVPDVILMDVQMPNCNGIEGTRLIKEKYGSIKILMLTSFEDEKYISQALKFGADGYILKDIDPNMLRHAIRSVYNGMPIMHKNVLAILTKSINNSPGQNELPEVNKCENFICFTQRELEIMGLISKGKTNTDIAKEVCLSKGRVANIITNIFEKVGLNDRTELAVFAVKNNYVY